jgi:hypothetical protein
MRTHIYAYAYAYTLTHIYKFQAWEKGVWPLFVGLIGEKGTLTTHIKTVHEKRRDHACGYCKGVTFGTASGWRGTSARST